MKKFLAMILALVMALSLVACGAKDDEKGSVYWLNFKPESKDALEEIAAMYTEETGVEVKIVTAASGEYNSTLTAEMDKEEAPTIFVVGNAAAAKEWSDYCLDLKGTAIANELNTDAYNVYDENGKLCSIGYCYECYGIIVNTKLLKDAGYELSDITNFDSLKKVAEDITARSADLGFSAFGSAGMGGSSSWRYTGHLINLEYYYESVDDPAAWASCPAEIKGTYMDNFKNLYDLMVNNATVDRATLSNLDDNGEAEFCAGKAVFYVNGNWEWSAIEKAGFTADQVAMIPYYCGVAGEEKAGLNCGTENCWAINAKASEADQKATMDFLVWLVTDAEASAKAVATFGVMPYKKAVASSNPFLADANEYANAGNYTMPWVTNFQPNVDAYRAAAVSAMNDYNAAPSDATWEKVEAAFIAGWATQYKEANK
ncbi:MAG: carbohydrate ABC transporter substrate-binding protein [Ruminococcaceae bacterium]|nr:carbohydrate ABC transporter substrate-binding protein [Oscillospiraceae bacterium]